MSIALGEFWTRLIESGISDADGCKRIASAFCDANGGSPPAESVSLAKYLIKSGDLTEFQARALLAGRGLRIGSLVVRSDQGVCPWSLWTPAQRGDGSTGFLFRATPDHLAGGREAWLETHADIAAATLQPIDTELVGEEQLVFSAIPPGRSLAELSAEHSKSSPATACQIGIAVADAIDAMHARSLIHGCIRADRVWVGDTGKTVLLRDPSGPPPRSFVESPYGWLDHVDPPEAYAAPELASGTEERNAATDIYSLGCLLYQIVTGNYPHGGDSVAEVMAAHASQTPPELTEAIQKGEAGDPLFRVIAFAMAKSPQARFGSVRQLADALRATLPLIPQPTATKSADAKPKVEKKIDRTQAAPARGADKGKAVDQAKPVEKSKTGSGANVGESKRREKAVPEKVASAKAKPRDKTKTPEKRSPADKAIAADGGKRSQRPAQEAESKNARRPEASKVSSTKPDTPSGPAPTPPVHPLSDQLSPPVAAPPAELPPEDVLSIRQGDAIEPPETPPVAPPNEPTSPDRQLRRRKKKKSRTPLMLGALCFPVLMLLIVLIVRPDFGGSEKPRDRTIPDYIPPVSNRSGNDVPDSASPGPQDDMGYELVDDERLLWVTPYRADSASAPLGMLPPGPGAIVSLRLAAVSGSATGKGIIDTLSPELDGLIASIADRAKVPLAAISRCGIALHPGKDGMPDVSLAIELSAPRPLSELTKAWGVDASRTRSGATIYAGEEVDGDAYYVAPAQEEEEEGVSRFAVGSVDRISEVAENEGGSIPLPRSLEKLWKASSEQADFVMLVTPNFLFADARALLTTAAPELVPSLKTVLIPDVAGALVTADLVGENVYAEVRLVPSGGVSEPVLLQKLRTTIGGWPDWAEEFVVDAVPDASWRRLASRLPNMMRFMKDQTRFGVSEGNAVANVYVPSRAMSQVSLALLLAMNTKPGSGSVAVSVAPAKPLTVDEMLDRKMSVSFDQESLEFAVNTIVDEFKRSLPAGSTMPPVRIVGGDLEKMGITQNQQIRDFSKSDEPLRSVLTDLVLGANPDKTATGPADAKQSLIWVVADDPESPGSKAILVTTRVAAEGNYDLPREFVLADEA